VVGQEREVFSPQEKEIDVDTLPKHARSMLVLRVLFTGMLVVASMTTAQEVGRTLPEVGQEAPDFTLPSTTGEEISLRQFRGKKLVLLEFYGVDFAPT
jgi:cytochrome oxidase Cu insertion factor (SCO1/SenC/PrrC family)